MFREEYLSKIFEEIKHWNFTLDNKAIYEFVERLNNIELDGREAELIVLCLSLGSNYLQENPKFLKIFFKNQMIDGSLSNVFKAIKYARIGRYYINELEYFSSLEYFLGEEFCIDFYDALGTLGISRDIPNRFNRIERKLKNGLTVYNKNNIHKDEVKDYIKRCFEVLLMVKHPKKWHYIRYEINDIIKDLNIIDDLEDYINSLKLN
ncbi:MAG: hypothetical protein ACJAUH_001240 [Saprospiraceae bacterium]|jgi:hypothetical protein